MAKYKKKGEPRIYKKLGGFGMFGGGFSAMNERAYKNAEKNLAKMK
jgi:hypothetical protein